MKYDIIYSYSYEMDEDEYTTNLRESFEGTRSQLQEYINSLYTQGYFNIEVYGEEDF